jgi:hypothetical protein
MRTLKTTDDLSDRKKSPPLSANALAIEVICAIFGLRSPMMPIPAHDLPVISDSETFSYSGQNLKVPGLVFAVLISRLRAAFIVQGSLRLAARKTIRLLMAALSLILTASHSQAGLGWTLAQFEQQYGKPVLDQEQIAGRTGYVFRADDYVIAAFLRNAQVSRILYICRGGSVFDWERARALLAANAPAAIWNDASKNQADNFYRVNGTKDGVESYYASLTNDGKMLAIWTKEDDEAGRTKPGLDTPSDSSVVDSSGKSTGEGTAGHRPSVDGELTPELNHPDVPANANSSSPPQPPAPAHAFHTKIARVKHRTPMSRRQNFHVAHFDAKARSAEASPQKVESYPAAPTPNLMNTGTELYNSDYTQPFKNAKKTP